MLLGFSLADMLTQPKVSTVSLLDTHYLHRRTRIRLVAEVSVPVAQEFFLCSNLTPFIMSLLTSLKPSASSSSSSTTESVDVVISTLSAPISGKYGNFRQFTMNGESYSVDDSRVLNAQVFKPNAKATLTLQQYTNKEGKEKVIVAGLNIHLPEGCGLFIMK